MDRAAGLAGSAAMVLDEGVRLLHPEPGVFDAMIEGWRRQQASRYLREATIAARVGVVRRLASFSGQYPWQWTAEELEAFCTQTGNSGSRMAFSTVRGYQNTIRLFCEYVTDVRYGWAAECLERFGRAPVQIAHEWNTVAHVDEYEGDPRRRALTYDEVQALFDAADGRVEAIRARGRKGALAALRDAVLLKTIYAFGLRRREAVILDLHDFRRNPRAGHLGVFGSVQVRYGKASRGAPAKRRTVLTVPEMDWIVETLVAWRDEARPLLAPGAHPAVFVTERRGRMQVRHANDAFNRAVADAGLPTTLDLHCLRHFLPA